MKESMTSMPSMAQMKKRADSKWKMSTVTLILVIELIVMVALLAVITWIVSTQTRQNSLDHMATITDERAAIITNYIEEAENMLREYSLSAQVRDRLADPDDKKDTELPGNRYSSGFIAGNEAVEGIYVSTWDTKILSHSNSTYNGMSTFDTEGENGEENRAKLEELQNKLTELRQADESAVYNAGIITHPLSPTKQIIAMYKGVFDEEGNPLGIVGLGLYVENLVRRLDSLAIRGLSGTRYFMYDINDRSLVIPHFATQQQDTGDTAKERDVMVEREENIFSLCSEAVDRGMPDNLLSGHFSYRAETKDEVKSVEKKRIADHENAGRRMVATYTIMKDYGWVLTLDAPFTEVYRLTVSMILFLGLFGLLIIGLIAVFHWISKQQEEAHKKLLSQIAKTAKTKTSLETAMFHDLLTDVSNRVSFMMDMQKAMPDEDHCYYFVMFNIAGFSDINAKHGSDAGDQVLLSTAEALKKIFLGATVYRTGSDEFVVAVLSEPGEENRQHIMNNIDTAHAVLLSPVETPAGPVTAEYRAAAVKKTERLSASIISELKELTKKHDSSSFGQVPFKDLDQKRKKK